MQFDTFKEKLSIDIGGTFSPDPWEWATGETESTATTIPKQRPQPAGA